MKALWRRINNSSSSTRSRRRWCPSFSSSADFTLPHVPEWEETSKQQQNLIPPSPPPPPPPARIFASSRSSRVQLSRRLYSLRSRYPLFQTFDFRIRGVNIGEAKDERQQALARLSRVHHPIPVLLIREPDNPVDPGNAIAVRLLDGSTQLGYVPKDVAPRIPYTRSFGVIRSIGQVTETTESTSAPAPAPARPWGGTVSTRLMLPPLVLDHGTSVIVGGGEGEEQKERACFKCQVCHWEEEDPAELVVQSLRWEEEEKETEKICLCRACAYTRLSARTSDIARQHLAFINDWTPENTDMYIRGVYQHGKKE